MVGGRHLLETGGGVVAAAATPAGSSRNRTGEAELTQANFDTNMVIILAALLCALICVLGLNSMVRCVLRYTRRLSDVEMAQQAAAKTGLKKSVLRKIPIFVYGSDHDKSGSGKTGSECPICLGEFVEGEKVRVLPKCNHGFHVRCIDTWLGSHSSCPNCRQSVIETVRPSKVAPPHGPPHGGGREGHVVVQVGYL